MIKRRLVDITLIVGISLAVLTVAVIALLCGLFYFLFRETRRTGDRISNLEAESQAMREKVARILVQLPPGSGNSDPPDKARRDWLLRKFEANTIARDEAIELNEILAAEEQAARRKGDIATAVAIGLGIALLAALLARRR